MSRFTWDHKPRLASPAALLQAAALLVTLIAAPELHRYTCSGVCSAPKFARNGETACGHCCQGEAQGHSKRPGGHARGACNCLDDCCSWTAVFAAPDAPADAVPVALVTPAPPLQPIDLPRAPGTWLLPFSTGPPSAV
jgi:hypothetical protein